MAADNGMSLQRLLLSVVVCVLLPACSGVDRLTRPEGDGGWSPERRTQEIGRLARRAGVDFAPGGGAARAAPHLAAIAGPLDLPTALQLALQYNRRIAVADKELDAARDRFRDARGRLLPTTTGSGRYTWYTDAQTTDVNLAGLLPEGAIPPTVKVRDSEAGTLNGTLALPLDVFGELRHILAAAQAGYRGEQARVWATTLDEQVAVVRAYFALLEAQRLRVVTQQTIALDRQQLANAQSRFDNGRLTKNQLLVVQVALRNAEQALVRRDLAVDAARWALNDAIGAAVNAPTAIVDVDRRPIVPTVDAALHDAYEHNPVLQALVEEQQRLEETVTALERSRLPRFSAGGAVDYSSSTILQPQQIGSGFTGFTWDLGTDTRREAQIAEARANADRNRIVIERQVRAIESAVRTTHGAAEERLAALATAQAAVGQAGENLRIRQQQFDAGRATSEDVLDAEALLSQQRAALATALYQAHTRRAELQQLIGLPLAEEWSAMR